MSVAPGPAIHTRSLVLAHGSHVAVDGADLDLPRGTIIACIGPNGSGKSSFLDAVAGLLSPRSGSISVLGEPPGRGRVAYVFQSTETPAHLPLTVTEVVTMGRYGSAGLIGRLGPSGRAEVRRAMERVGITDLAERQLLELSGGQRQRVLVAQGLASSAEMLVLDEPMTGLDVTSRERILEVMAEERAEGRTVVFSTHDLSEASEADRVVLLAGRLIAAGTPEEVLVEEHLVEAYRGRVVDVAGVRIIDDPHHHGARADRHDGHDHSH
ncbi:MAG: metal ABC transporter ATP-binding protein [Actinomycetota bacterium]|nr:metal ABC transporter ATP-binding protein [Actinomycetota bacterium]